MTTSTLRPNLPSHSPTSSASSQTTTPTSPRFAHHNQVAHPYASSSYSLDRAAVSSTSLASTPMTIHHPRPPTPPLFRPPPNLALPQYLKTWGEGEIQQFLSIYKCGHYIDAFRQNDIDGNVLLDLDMPMLKELGVAKVGERVKLLSGIKDLRKRVSVARSLPKVELRLNGAPTPPLDDGAFMGGGRLRQQQESSSLGNRRLHSNRPAPLDLQPHASRNLPQAYQGNPPSATHSQTSHSTTPRPIPPVEGLVRRPSDYTSSSGVYGSSSRPSLASYASSSSTVMPASGGSVPPPASRAGTQSSNFNLRAPPSRDPGRRSPSPVNDASNFIDRPLPPAPSHGPGQGQSSAAEYANAITQQRQNSASTPTWAQSDHQYGLPRAPAPGSADRRTAAQAVAARAIDPVHRKTPSMEAMSASANKKSTSPIKSKFQGILGRPQPAQHPFAAPRTVEERKPSPPQGTSGASNSAPGQSHRRQLTASSALPGAASSAPSSTVAELRSRRPGAEASSSGLPALEELIKQVVKFTNVEDGTTRTVNVQTCNSGVDVLERVLKKFGKWRATNIHTDTESDDDGNFEVDGWGVYTEQDDDDAKPLSEHALLQVCRLHRDGTTLRGKGLYLKRTRKLQNRKNMESLLGEAPPLSPTSPTGYYTHNPVGRSSLLPVEDPNLLTPSKAAGSKKMNRASTVSIMSGLGVPLSEIPPSPTTRSPSSGGILTKKKMYNFFGHRPPSELISNHLAEYFPNATKKTLEKTARHSSIRMSLGPNNPLLNTRNSFMSIEGGRRSLDVPPPLPGKRGSIMSTKDAIARDSPPRRSRPGSRGVTSPPAASTIVEESETLLEPVPRVSVSNDDGRTSRPTIDGEPATRDSHDDAASISSVQSQPPLLPPFEPSSESLSDSLQAYSPTPQTAKPRPRSIALQRRESAGSTRSRMSMLSQLRRQQDRSDTASLLTVDEITAEVEQRRASTITFEESDEDEDEEKVLAPPTGNVASGEIGVGVPESEDEGDDEAEEEEEEEEFSDEDESEEESDGAEDADHGRAFTSEGSKRSIKWIKGALIGAGSFGSVYLGMDAHTGLLMAVKQVELPTGVLRNEERKQSMVTALEREIELLKDLQHENIVQYLDSSADGDCLNIFLEYVPGGSVAALLSNYGAFEEALVRNFCRQILTGLNYLHQREIIHRDIKGANILVDNKGGIKISDFGISKKVENNLMNSMRGGNRPSLQGSVFWMAPEIVKQTSHTTKADIWSVGCLVVEMLTGTHPWADLSQMQAIFKIGSQARPATPSDISPDAADFLHKTFEIDYKMRPTAQQLLEHPFLAQRPTQLISAQQAKASMAAAQKAMQGGMQSMGQVLGKA